MYNSETADNAVHIAYDCVSDDERTVTTAALLRRKGQNCYYHPLC